MTQQLEDEIPDEDLSEKADHIAMHMARVLQAAAEHEHAEHDPLRDSLDAVRQYLAVEADDLEHESEDGCPAWVREAFRL